MSEKHIGFIGRCVCKGCTITIRKNVEAFERSERRGHRFSYVVKVLRAAYSPNDFGLMCAKHKRLIWFRQIDGKHNPEHACDARCTNATGPNCECSCGGANHGASHCC